MDNKEIEHIYGEFEAISLTLTALMRSLPSPMAARMKQQLIQMAEAERQTDQTAPPSEPRLAAKEDVLAGYIELLAVLEQFPA